MQHDISNAYTLQENSKFEVKMLVLITSTVYAERRVKGVSYPCRGPGVTALVLSI